MVKVPNDVEILPKISTDWNSVGAPRKSLPQGASDVVTPLRITIVNRYRETVASYFLLCVW